MRLAAKFIVGFLCLSFFFMFSCKNSTSTQKGDVVGTIHLDGESNHSGISVSIYQAGLVPDEITQISQEYPQLAFPLTEKHVFDHREHAALQTVYTNAEGRFDLTDIPYGEYIVVYRKEGWGFNNLTGIVLDKTELDVSAISNSPYLQLYTETIVPIAISGEYIFQSEHCYIVAQNSNALSGSSLVFGSNSRILFYPGSKLSIYGACSFPELDEFVLLTSYAGVHEGSSQNDGLGDGLVVWEDMVLHNIISSHLSTCIFVRAENVEVRNVLVKSSEIGITVNNVSDFAIHNSIIMDNTSLAGAALHVYSVDNCAISYNLFYGNLVAVKHEIVNSSVHDNAFIENAISFDNTADSNSIFEFNIITSSAIGAKNSGKSNLEIMNCNINAAKCVVNETSNHVYNLVNAGWTKASFNNFLATDIAVESIAGYYYSDGPYPLDFTNNYWGVTTTEAISALITDYYDLGLVVGSGVSSVVIFQPYRSTKVPNTGIR